MLHLGSSSPYFGKMNTSAGLCAGNYAPAPFPVSWMVASSCPCTPGSMLQCRLASSPPSRGPSARIHKIREKAAKVPVFHGPVPFVTAAKPRSPGGAPGGLEPAALALGGEGRGGAPLAGSHRPYHPLCRGREAVPRKRKKSGGGVRPLPGPWQRVAMQPRQLRWETLAALRTSSKGQLSYCRHWLQDEVRVRSRRAAGSPWACASWGRLRGEIGDSPLRALAER